jgi:TetR/AcrR family transcriptional regulator, transcriptional repressor for nem operon
MPRSREYDHNKLLTEAMSAFWTNGFARTTMDDIVKRTGVNRASLYAAYPDKRELFLAALQHYLETVTSKNLHKLEHDTNAAESIRSFLRHLIKQPASAVYSATGCLLTNTAIELGDSEEDVAVLVRKAFARVEDALRRRLTEARDQGDLSADADPEQLAKHLLVLIQGIRVMSRLGVEQRFLKQAVESALKLIK